MAYFGGSLTQMSVEALEVLYQIPKRCRACGLPFKPTAAGQKFCSEKCRKTGEPKPIVRGMKFEHGRIWILENDTWRMEVRP